MILGSGNAFGRMLMNAKGTCPNCNTELTFEMAAQFAKSHGIDNNVVMCTKCSKVYETYMVPGKMTLTNDVTSKYPQIKSKKDT